MRADAKGRGSIRFDNWYNPISGIGTDRDRMQSGFYSGDFLLSWQQLSNLYYGDPIAAKMNDARTLEAFRKGFAITSEDPEGAEDLHRWARVTHDIESKIVEAITWGRLFGGALLILGANDGQALDQPLREESIRSVDYAIVVDRRYAVPASFYQIMGPKIGRPETYRVAIQSLRSTQMVVVHESRCVRFGALKTDPIRARLLYGWDLPVLQRPYEVLRAFGQSMQGAGIMVSEASQGVFKLKDLVAMIANDPDALQTRMQMVDMGRSLSRSLMLDADNESFEKIATSFAGVPETLDRFMQWLSAASDTPVAILMGRSAAGLNATGDLDLASWNASVASYQANDLAPKVHRVFEILQRDRTCPTKGKPLPDLDIEWAPLSVPSDKEDADAYLTRANGDQVYVAMGALDPAEVGIARFGRGKYSTAAPIVNVERLQAEIDATAKFEPPEAPDANPAEQPPGKSAGGVDAPKGGADKADPSMKQGEAADPGDDGDAGSVGSDGVGGGA